MFKFEFFVSQSAATTSPAEMPFAPSVFNLQGSVTSEIRARWTGRDVRAPGKRAPSDPTAGRGTSCFRGSPSFRLSSDLTQLDLVRDLVREADAADGQNHLRRQLLIALELAGLNRFADSFLDFALRGDADLLQESAQAGIEDVFVHDGLLARASLDCSASARRDCAGLCRHERWHCRAARRGSCGS